MDELVIHHEYRLSQEIQIPGAAAVAVMVVHAQVRLVDRV
jgi:hypothetical protein